MQAALQRATGGIPAATFSDGENLLKIVVRGEKGERDNTDILKNTPVWGATLSSVPLEQVAEDKGVVWENGIVARRNRFPTITVGADPVKLFAIA